MSDSNNLHRAPFYIINDCLFSTDGSWLWPGLINASSYKVSIINFPIYDQLLECMVHYTQQGLRQALWIDCTEQMVSKLLAFFRKPCMMQRCSPLFPLMPGGSCYGG